MPGDEICSYTIENKAQVFFDYQVRSRDALTNLGKTSSIVVTSNTVVTYSKFIEVDLTETTEQEVLVCESLCYKIVLMNKGNVTLFNTCLLSHMPKEVCVIEEGVTINGDRQPRLDPSRGFELGVIEPDECVVITFCVCVLEVPPGDKLYNQVQFNYDYQIDAQDWVRRATQLSNRVETKVKEMGCTILKKVSHDYVYRHEYLAYEVLIQNTGNVELRDVRFKDPLDQVLALEPGTVTINGKCYDGYEPDKGFGIENIKAYECCRITFCVKVMDLPSTKYVTSASEVTFCYQLMEESSLIEEISYSNETTSELLEEKTAFTTRSNRNDISNQPITFSPAKEVQVIQQVDVQYATLNDVIGYSIKIFNNSSVKVDQVRLRDVIPIEEALIKDSVRIDGVVKPGYDPYESFVLGGIAPGEIVVVSFSTRVRAVPPSACITHTAVVTFACKNVQTHEILYKEVQSHKVSTQIKHAALSILESVDKKDAGPLEILTYTFVLMNTGSVELDHIVLIATLQQEVVFRKGSVCIDGQPTRAHPQRGIPLGKLPSRHTVKVTFQVKVAAHPDMGLVINSGRVAFQYRIDPEGGTYAQTIVSNQVCTFLRVPQLIAKKAVNQRYHMLLDQVAYTIQLINVGNTPLHEVFFQDLLPQELSFIEASVTLDELPHKTLNPLAGFYIPTIEMGCVVTVRFSAQITALPARGYGLVHSAMLTRGDMIQETNPVMIEVREGNLSIVQCVNAQYAQVGESLTYTFLLTHIGNVSLRNLCFFDKLDPALAFRDKSVVINGKAYPDLDPTIGIRFKSVWGNQQLKIQFDVQVKQLPEYREIMNKGVAQFCYQVSPGGLSLYKTQESNGVTTAITLGDLGMTQCCDKALVAVGEVMTYTVQIINKGNARATHICFKPLLREGVTLLSDEIDPISGMVLDDLEIGCIAVVGYQVFIKTKPFGDQVIGQSVVQFAYEPYPDHPEVYKNVYSNKHVTQVVIGDMDVIKKVDKEIAMVGEKLTYTISLINTGNTNAQNVYFIDALPSCAVFVSASVFVNGGHYPEYHPQVGFKIGTITPGQTIKITYQVHVVK